MGMQNVSFGSLTKIHQLSFGEFDENKDGVITQEELQTVAENGGFDMLDISAIDKNADQKVTHEEFVLWQQEAEMSDYLKKMKDQSAKDLLGQDQEDINKLVNKLIEFEKSFKETYKSTHKNLEGMAAVFTTQLTVKYNEFKKDVLTNTKSAVISRVVNSVVEDFAESDKNAGGTFLSLVDSKASSLSDNAKRMLSNELTREAEKFVKKYEGENLEKDLNTYLNSYLAQTDKEKLADAIGVWEKGKQELEELPAEIKFMQLKAKAKEVLLTALENDISLKIGDIVVRSETAIPAVLGQYKDVESLKRSFDKALSELSSKTRAQEIKEKDEERRTAALEEAYKEMKKDDSENIFM